MVFNCRGVIFALGYIV